MKIRLLQTAFAAVLATLAAATPAPAQTPAHLAAGFDLVDQIVAAQQAGVYAGEVNGATVFLNRYGGSWNSTTDASFIRFFDQATGTYAANYTTCAPLVTHLLKYAYDWNWKNFGIPDPLNNDAPACKASPSSYLYVSAIKHLVGFAQRSLTLADVRPGDIAARWEIGTDTGHTMLVVSVNFASSKAYPAASTDANFLPALADTTYVEMTVLDSSASGHSNDTRYLAYNGVTGLSGGAGEGVMGVFIDATGQVVAHTWSLPTSNYLSYDKTLKQYVVSSGWLSGIKSRAQMQDTVELVFGRLAAPTP